MGGARAKPCLALTGVVDGGGPGGLPKALELFVSCDVTDASDYGLGSANNGGGSDGEEFTFPALAWAKGSFVYVARALPSLLPKVPRRPCLLTAMALLGPLCHCLNLDVLA
jgi:hypothetical protein